MGLFEKGIRTLRKEILGRDQVLRDEEHREEGIRTSRCVYRREIRPRDQDTS